MSEEIALAAADLETVRQLRAALEVAFVELEQLREGHARAWAQVAQYRRGLEAVVHFWRRDPLAFGDEASVTTLAGQFADVAHLCEDVLELDPAGAALLAELEAARVVVRAARTWSTRETSLLPIDKGDVAAQGAVIEALRAYDAAVKANEP